MDAPQTHAAEKIGPGKAGDASCNKISVVNVQLSLPFADVDVVVRIECCGGARTTRPDRASPHISSGALYMSPPEMNM
jgi:hypothetical protein